MVPETREGAPRSAPDLAGREIGTTDSETNASEQPETLTRAARGRKDRHVLRCGCVVRIIPPLAKSGLDRRLHSEAEAIGFANGVGAAKGWPIIHRSAGDLGAPLSARPRVFVREAERGIFAVSVEPRPLGAPRPKEFFDKPRALAAAAETAARFAIHGKPLAVVNELRCGAGRSSPAMGGGA